jgi:hypothetical protein
MNTIAKKRTAPSLRLVAIDGQLTKAGRAALRCTLCFEPGCAGQLCDPGPRAPCGDKCSCCYRDW